MGRYAMIIILALYLVLVWLLFFKLKLVRLSWLSGTLAGVIGAVILAVFVALLANLTPSGRFAVNAPVVTITPNVSGQVIALPIQPNVPLKTGAVLFQIDPVALPVQGQANRGAVGGRETERAAAQGQLRSSYCERRGPDIAARISHQAALVYFNRNRSRSHHAIPAARYAKPGRRGQGSTARGPGCAAKRQAGIGFGD